MKTPALFLSAVLVGTSLSESPRAAAAVRALTGVARRDR